MKKMYEESNIQDIANAIREKNGSTDTYKPSEMGDAIRGISGGGSGEEEIFFTTNGTMYKKNHVIPIDGENGFYQYAYRYADKMETLEVPLLRASYSSTAYVFQGCTSLKSVIMPRITKLGNQFFSQCTSLETVVLGCEEYPMAELHVYTFMGCESLKNFEYTGVIPTSLNLQQSQPLTNASVQNIIDCLVDLTGQTSQVITFHANVKSKLTEEQIATITAKNWTLA